MITKIQYNWRQEADGEERWAAWSECETYEVGKDGVAMITEWIIQGDGARHSCVVNFKDGHSVRVFNINKVITDSRGF